LNIVGTGAQALFIGHITRCPSNKQDNKLEKYQKFVDNVTSFKSSLKCLNKIEMVLY